MKLSKPQILEAHASGKIGYLSDKYDIADFANNQSVDIHLGRFIWVPFEDTESFQTFYDRMECRNGIEFCLFDLRKCPIHARRFLAHSEESIGTLPNSGLHPEFHVRSTAARMFLNHGKAGFGDMGYSNIWTMEWENPMMVEISEGMRLAQISFDECHLGDDYSQGGNYQNGTMEEARKNWKPEDMLPKEGGLF